MNKAKNCLLLILSLLAGCEGCKMENCTDGWVNFTCNDPDADRSSRRVKQSPDHDPQSKTLTVIIKCKDIESYQCHPLEGSSSNNLQLEFELDSCQSNFTPIVNQALKKSIMCAFPVHKHKTLIFCKNNDSRCEDSSLASKLPSTVTDRGFNASSVVVYRCEQKENKQPALRKIRVKGLQEFQKITTIGEKLSYFCRYDKNSHKRIICKGDDPSTCQPLLSTDSPTNNRFSMKNETNKFNITVTVTAVRAEDDGIYWCTGENGTNVTRVYHRCNVIVGARTTSTTAAHSTQSPPSHGHQDVIIGVSVCAAVMLLLFILNLIFFYKRLSLLRKSSNGSDAEPMREENVYEEIQEPLQKSVMTIYATADFPTNPSDSLCYSRVKLDQSPDRDVKPSSSACDYSTVRFVECPAPSAASEPSTNEERCEDT